MELKDQPIKTKDVKVPYSSTKKEPMGNFRWRIIALLFFATTINYIDRQVLSLVVTDESFLKEVGLAGPDGKLNKEMFGYLDAVFKFAYAIGFLFMGNMLDKIGNRKGFSIAIAIWSVAAMAHSMARSVFGLGIFRFFLGIGEAGNFPACVKTVAEWFPKKERSFATGVFNAGSNIGAILAPIFVSYFLLNYSWEYAFIVTGGLGFIWLIFWLRTYKSPEFHTTICKAELAHIQSDPKDPIKKFSWGKLLKYKATWAFTLGKFLTDPIWFIYLTWLPTFFKEEHGVDIKNMVVPMIIIYLISDVGSVAGGWLSSFFISKGWSVNKARKTTMFICALAVVPVFFASMTENIWVAIGIISIAAAAHQGFSANIYTTVSDSFPNNAVASVTGIGGMGGAIGGMIIAALSGIIYQKFGPLPLFLLGSFAYLIALFVINALNPKLEKVNL